MTPIRVLISAAGLLLFASLAGCFGGDKAIRDTCDEPQPYQSVVAGKRVEVPDGLDPLDEFKEMPLPKAETAPRPAGAVCIESPPSILSGGTLAE